jgi:uncharacterized protein (DUF305 family)
VKRFSHGLGRLAVLSLALALALALASAGFRVAEAQVEPPPIRFKATKADVEFMQGMISHHAQALVMANLAPSHGASSAVRILCARIVVGQSAEIKLIQEWLRVRGFPVPDSTGKMPPDPSMPGMDHSAMGHDMMPGMLDADQMKLLDNARGPSFDRLFLTFMIQHHEGALVMVDKLFKTPAAGQDDDIAKFATGVHADQTAEIDRMKSMLAAGGGTRF